MFHWLAHLFEINHDCEVWWVKMAGGEKLMVGWRCYSCGKLSNIHPAGAEFIFDNYPDS